MAFLFQDQNQGIRNDVPRGMRLSRPFSFIRTLTVGFGIAPNLLTLARGGARRSRAWVSSPNRRWGISPRPESIGRPGWTTSGNYDESQPPQQASGHGESACPHAAGAARGKVASSEN